MFDGLIAMWLVFISSYMKTVSLVAAFDQISSVSLLADITTHILVLPL